MLDTQNILTQTHLYSLSKKSYYQVEEIRINEPEYRIIDNNAVTYKIEEERSIIWL